MLFDVGRTYRRGDIHDRYGGQSQGGISTPAAHPIVLCISGDEGAPFGYADEELDDGTFLYFGEGQVGDMTFERSANRAIRDDSGHGSLESIAYRVHSARTAEPVQLAANA